MISRETQEQDCPGPEASVVSQVSGYVCPHHSWGPPPLHHSPCLRSPTSESVNLMSPFRVKTATLARKDLEDSW